MKEKESIESDRMKAWKHLNTVMHHKWLVMKGCFKVGLYWQGITHDLSKFSPTEFLVGCKYFQGTRSPNNAEREEKGYSSSWLHHKGRNKHHFEYWIDYGMPPKKGMTGMKMPNKYVVEMLMDRIAASKVYKKENYTDASPLEYYKNGKDKTMIHEETRAILEFLLNKLANEGEDALYSFIKKELLGKKTTHVDLPDL